MKVHLELRDETGMLFCGTVEAPSTTAALTLKLEELRLAGHLGLQRQSALRIKVEPTERRAVR